MRLLTPISALFILLSAGIAYASPPPCVTTPDTIEAIDDATLIFIGEPTTSPPTILHPDTSWPLNNYEEIAVKQVLKGTYDQPAIPLMATVGYGTNPGGFGVVQTKVIFLTANGTDQKTHKILYGPSYPPECGGGYLEMEGNDVIFKIKGKTERFPLDTFVKQFITKQ